MQKVILFFANHTFDTEYEIKGLVQDFDKFSRKQIAALKKAKTEKLVTRAGLLASYGLHSRERISKFIL